MSEGWGLGRGRALASPAFPQDDGTADPRVRALLADTGVDALDAARRLRAQRLLTSVVAVLDEVDPDGGDKDSHMAVVSMVNERGERGLLAFSGVDSLVGWNADARPVPALGREVARAALDDGCAAVVIDVSGPARWVIAGSALLALADLLDLEAVRPRLVAALAGLTADGWVEVDVLDARADGAVDVLVVVQARQGGHPDGRTAEALARQAAGILAGRADLHALIPGGIGVSVG